MWMNGGRRGGACVVRTWVLYDGGMGCVLPETEKFVKM